MISMIESQKAYFQTGETKSYAFRRTQLNKLHTAIKMNEDALVAALKADLNKSSFEAYATEIGYCLHSIRKTLKHLKQWMRPTKVRTPFFHIFTKSYTRFEPLGQILIIGPYNYPFQLVIEPLIGAMAAGNTIVLKPSEFPSATEKAIKFMIEESFDPHYISVITGDSSVAKELLKHRFDHIFFTGSTRVGQLVYQAAAQHLTPVTLELGGKSPVIIDETANLAVAANRVVFGKFINAGQTCVAPDYVYVHKTVKASFLNHLQASLKRFYPNHEADYGRLINDDHFNRLSALISEDKAIGDVVKDKQLRLIAPVIMQDVTWEDAVMKEEIFGPILPVLEYTDMNALLDLLKTKEKPLALYLFSEHRPTQVRVFETLTFGSGAINDTITQVANWYLPFGGVGHSGIGHYHGKASFETCSHLKTWIKKSTRVDLKIAYPPYKNKEKWVRRLFR